MSKVSIDKDVFLRRIQRLYSCWKGNEEGSALSVDAIVSLVGQDEDVIYSKSTALQQWLFGYELTDTIMLLCDSGMYFLSSKKKIEFLKPIQEGQKQMENIPPIHLLLRNKADNDAANFKQLVDGIKGSKEGKTVGVFVKDKFSGDFADSWKAAFEGAKFEKKNDISPQFAYIMSVKEDVEVALIKKAAYVTSMLFDKFFKQQVVKVVDEEKSIKHSKLADQIEQALEGKKYIGAGMDADQLEMCYSPIIQSGGKFSLKFSAVSSDEKLNFGVITCAVGVRYKFYCSNIVRTLMVEPTQNQQDHYNYLLTVLDFLFENLKPGLKLSDVYNTTAKHVEKEKPELKDKFVKNIGFVTGIEFREGSMLIDQKHNQVIKKGMVFNANIGLINLENKDAKEASDKTYALFLGETVVVNEEGAATVLTSSKKQLKNIGMFLKDPEELEKEDDAIDIDEKFLPEKKQREISAENKRKDHQKELTFQINEEARKRMLEKVDGKDAAKTKVRTNIAYKNNTLIPRDSDVQDLKVFVDRKYEAVVIPLFGLPTPFHISTIKNVSSNIEGDYSYLRINFFCPGSSYGRGDGNLFSNPDATYVKEIVFRSSNMKEAGESQAPATNLNNAFRLIKDVQKKFKTREAEEKEKEGVVKQEDLIIHQSKGNPRLKDIYMRPTLTSRKCTGSLEAHVNGFRYQTIKGEKCDLLYKNVKHAFFQPCDGEMVIILHFHLKHPIIIGKKKYRDIQWFTEVGEMTTDLGKRQHMHDRDDLHAEQAERDLRKRLKAAFKGFIDKIEGLTDQQIEFDVPFKELGFYGVPFKSSVLLLPSTHCIVNLTEQPPFIVTLDDLELVHFERVQFHMKNFDMIFIYKDYARKVSMVSAIPMTSLDSVKDWLNSCDIKYTEGIQSLNWVKIMKTINDNPEDFFENGGWSFLEPNSDDEGSEEEETDEDDQEFKPDSDSDEASDEYDEEYDSGDAESEGGSDYEEELDSDQSSGKDWSDLEEEAKKDDRAKDLEGGAVRNDSDDDRKKKKSKKHKKESPKKRKREATPPKKSKKKKR